MIRLIKMLRFILYILCTIIISSECVPELKLLHIVFSHKTYAPISEIINNNTVRFPSALTYEYFHNIPLNMPNTGKLNMYNLGVYLRKTYGKFLGDVYSTEVMKMRTTEGALSIISGQLVNAGLWPPSEVQKWNDDFEWQPIPTDYVSMQRDVLLLGMHCPNFISEMTQVLNSEQVRKTMLHHLPLFEYVSHYTKRKIQRPSDIALVYATLETQADLNLSLPHWANEVFPHGGMYNVTLLEYDLLSHTPLQRQLNGGGIIKEIIGNSLKYIQGIMPHERKMMIYSGNDKNIVGVLKNMGLWSPHIPNEAASLIFEMYFDNETQIYGIKVNYYTGMDSETIALKIPSCTEICPLNTFLSLFFDVIPENENLLCKQKFSDLLDKEPPQNVVTGSLSSTYRAKNIIILSLLTIISFLH